MDIVAFVTSYDDQLAEQVQARLKLLGVQCPEPPASSMPEAARVLRKKTAAYDMVVTVCPPTLAQTLSVLERLRSLTTAPIVVLSSADSRDEVLETVRAGANDFVSLDHGLEEQLSEMVARIRARASKLKSQGRIIACVGAGGGCGVSTLACNLAAALAQSGDAVGLIDLALTGGDLATLLDIEPRHTIADLGEQRSRLDLDMFKNSLCDHATGVRLLAAPNTPTERPHIPFETIEEILALSRQMFHDTVIDLEDVFHADQLAAVHAADALVVILRLELPSMIRARRLLQMLQERGVAREKIHIIANRHGGGAVPQPRAKEALNCSVLHCIPEDYEAVVSSINVGNPMVVERPRSKAAAAMTKLAQFLTLPSSRA